MALAPDPPVPAVGAYASVDMTSHPVELSFLDGKASVTMTLASHWLKNLAAGKVRDV